MACFGKPSSADSDQQVRVNTPSYLADPDPENRYWDATLMVPAVSRTLQSACSRAPSPAATVPTPRCRLTP